MTMRWLAGRRFEFTDGRSPDFTVVGGDPETGTLRVHAFDGGRQYLPLALVVQAIDEGALVESTKAPFIFDRLVKTGFAGRGKSIMRWINGRWEKF
jgi:hypothetical protein